MKAPEKIYLYPSDRAGEKYEDEWGTFPWGEGCVEYTRTDVFIEKAVNFLSKEENLPLWSANNGRWGCHTSILVKDFVDYMKGE